MSSPSSVDASPAPQPPPSGPGSPISPPGPGGSKPTYGTTTVVWVVILIVVAAAIGGGAFYAGYEFRGSSSSAAAAANNTLSILGAGTLVNTFPSIADALVNETPGVSAPAAAQTYEGSIDITTAITQTGATTDVAALADFRLIPGMLEPTYASYEIVFAQTQEVLIYNSSLAAFHGVNASNWGWKLVQAVTTPGNKPLGVWNASTDPNGYNEIFSMMLQGQIYNGSNTSVYSQFYSGAPGAYATPLKATTIGEHESQAINLVDTGVVSAVITYEPIGFENSANPKLGYVVMNPIVGLGANNTTALNYYSKLSTKILGSTGAQESVVPAPILFAVTVPSNAPNAALGALFLHVLLSPQGSAILRADGWNPVYPGWAPTPSAVPGVLQPDVTTLPTWAAPFLPS